jgi:hypothetical protein
VSGQKGGISYVARVIFKAIIALWAVAGVSLLWFYPWVAAGMLGLLGLLLWLLFFVVKSALVQDG